MLFGLMSNTLDMQISANGMLWKGSIRENTKITLMDLRKSRQSSSISLAKDFLHCVPDSLMSKYQSHL